MKLITILIALLSFCSSAFGWDYVDRTLLAGDSDSSDPISRGWYEIEYGGDYKVARADFENAIANSPSEVAYEGLARVYEITGDYDNAVEYYLQALRKYPASPLAEVFLYRAYVLLEDTNKYDVMVSTISPMLDDPLVPGYLKGRIAIYLYELYKKRGKDKLTAKMTDAINPIRDWYTIGPFDNEGKNGFDEAYPPETEINLSATYEGKERDVRWRQLPYPEPNGFYSLSPVFQPDDFGTVYLTSNINSQEEQDMFLLLGSSGATKVWLNGELVFAMQNYNIGYFDAYPVPVTLKSGDNLILVKLNGDDNLWEIGVRFVDTSGTPLTRLNFDASLPAINRAKLTKPGTTPDIYPTFTGRAYFDEQIANGSADPNVILYSSMYHKMYADFDETTELAKQLLELGLRTDPNNLELKYHLGLYAIEPNVSRIAFEDILETSPQHLQAEIELVKYYFNLDRDDKTYNYLENVLSKNPEFIEATQYESKLAWEAGRPYEANAAAIAILQNHPDYIYAKMITSLYETDYGDLNKAERNLREIYNVDRTSNFAHEKLYSLYKQTDRVDKAIELANEITAATPYDTISRIAMGYDLLAAGRYEEAIQWFDATLIVCPENYEALAYKGEALEMMGRQSEAQRYYDLALEYKHNYPWLSDYLDYKSPEEPSLDEKRRYDTYEVIADYAGDDAYPEDNAVILLNDRTVEVYGNGTFSRTEHKIVKVLTPEGAEKYREMYAVYEPSVESVELKRMAVIKPNGEELTANQTYETNIFDVSGRLYNSDLAKVVMMPNLSPGDVIDFEYTVKPTGQNLFADYFGDVFQFGEFNSTAKARYTLSVPNTREFYFKTYRGVPAPTVEREKGNIIYTYELENLPNISQESYMPNIIKLTPLLRVSTFRTWDDVAKWYSGLIHDIYTESGETDVLADQLDRGGSDLDKLVDVYNFTVKKIRYVGLEFGVGGYRPRKPREVLQTSYGDCKDKATLMNMVFDNYGFKAYPVLIRMNFLGEPEYDLPMLGYFNHMISYVELPDGSGYFLDGTASFCAYDELPDVDQNIEALIIDGDKARLVRTPKYDLDQNTLDIVTEFVINNDGSGNVQRKVSYGAYSANSQRLRFESIAHRRKFIEDFWSGAYPGTVVSNDSYAGIDDLKSPVVLDYNAYVPGAFNVGDDKIILSTKLQPDYLLDSYAKRASRKYPLIIRNNRRYTSEMTYRFPDGYEISVAPLNKSYDTDFGMIATQIITGKNMVKAVVILDIYAQTIEPEDYETFRSFCLEVDMWEEEPIILKKK